MVTASPQPRTVQLLPRYPDPASLHQLSQREAKVDREAKADREAKVDRVLQVEATRAAKDNQVKRQQLKLLQVSHGDHNHFQRPIPDAVNPT